MGRNLLGTWMAALALAALMVACDGGGTADGGTDAGPDAGRRNGLVQAAHE